MAPSLWHLLHFGEEFERVRLAINNGEDVNSKRRDSSCFDGETTLIFAVNTKRIGIVKLLLEHPAIEVNSKDSKGLTALHFAVISKNIEAVRLLLDHQQVDVNCQDEKNGSTPLHIAAFDNNVAAIKMLLTKPGIDINIKDIDGNTPAMLAEEKNARSALRELVIHQRSGLGICSSGGGGGQALVQEEGTTMVAISNKQLWTKCLKLLPTDDDDFVKQLKIFSLNSNTGLPKYQVNNTGGKEGLIEVFCTWNKFFLSARAEEKSEAEQNAARATLNKVRRCDV